MARLSVKLPRLRPVKVRCFNEESTQRIAVTLIGEAGKTAQFACLFHTSHSFALILLLKEAKPATGRKRLHCNVCLGCVCMCVYVCVCVCVCVCVSVCLCGTSRGEAADVELETSCLCTTFKVLGLLCAHSLHHDCEVLIQNKTTKQTCLHYSPLLLPPPLFFFASSLVPGPSHHC